QENIEWLTLFNAPEGLIKLISPPPKPVAGGPLSVQCEASESHECEIIVNGRYYGQTEAGQKLISDLQPGEAKIRVWSEGLEPMDKSVSLNTNAPLTERFPLQRGLVARRENARELLSRIVQKRFGGVQGLSEMADLAANVAGTATIADGSSGPQE